MSHSEPKLSQMSKNVNMQDVEFKNFMPEPLPL